MAEEIIKTETGAAEQPETKPQKALIPFNVQPFTRQRFINVIGKATDETLNKLLDAYEHASEHTPETPEEVQQIITEKNRLNAELTESKKSAAQNIQQIKELEKQVSKLTDQLKSAQKAKPTETSADKAELVQQLKDAQDQLTDTLTKLKDAQRELTDTQITSKTQEKQITELNEQIETLKQNQNQNSQANADLTELQNEIAELKASIDEKDRMLKELDKLTKGQPDIKKLQQERDAAIEQTKQDRKALDGYEAAKQEADKELKTLRNQTKADAAKIKELETQLNNVSYQGYKDDNGFLSYFPELTANLLKATADKLTESRRDGQTITPAIICGDMFLKYTTQKRNCWFFNWVLGDDEIVAMAQKINPNVKSVRMLRKALDIDKELN